MELVATAKAKVAQIQAELKAVSTNRTTLIIAHRLSTIADADEIMVGLGTALRKYKAKKIGTDPGTDVGSRGDAAHESHWARYVTTSSM